MPPLDSLDCYAVTPPGVEQLTAGELLALGVAVDHRESGGVGFSAILEQLYRANLELRTAGRVMVRMGEFPARAFYELERKARRIPWGAFARPGAPIRFRVTSRKSKLYHLEGIAERLATVSGAGSAVISESDEDEGARPSQLFLVRVMRDVVTISADSSGELLHRRGYRLATGKAPLRETLAAAMLLSAGYDGRRPLVDPFCGSGTIPIEGARLARRIAPGLGRSFAFEHWPSFRSESWAAIRAEAESRVLPAAASPVYGSDRDAGVVEAARGNAMRAGVAENTSFECATISELNLPEPPGVLLTNPPYGVRVSGGVDLRNLYAALGSRFRSWGPGARLGVLAADQTLVGHLGLSTREEWRSTNGGIGVRLAMAD